MKNRFTDKNKNLKKAWTGCVFLAAGFLLMGLAKYREEFADWYSEHIYPLWIHTVGRFMGIFPFSVAEILLYLVLGTVLITGLRLVWKLIRKKAGKEAAAGWVCSLLLAAGVLYFLYVANCGINYYRTGFSESTGMETGTYTAEELQQVCQWLTQEVNRLGPQMDRDGNGVMELHSEVQEKAPEAMEKLGEKYPDLSGYYPGPKGLIFPWILSVQKLSGIYSPFTAEANYNSGMTDYNIPFTACHELSHLKGFMEEQEANFIAFLACTEETDGEFRYSGYMLGWIYCMNVLYDADYERWLTVREGLCMEAEADLAANREFWAAYDGKVAEVANQVNDHYLKANGQDQGVESYDRMVDLIVVWYADQIKE